MLFMFMYVNLRLSAIKYGTLILACALRLHLSASIFCFDSPLWNPEVS